jgi:hypothetical protein
LEVCAGVLASVLASELTMKIGKYSVVLLNNQNPKKLGGASERCVVEVLQASGRLLSCEKWSAKASVHVTE